MAVRRRIVDEDIVEDDVVGDAEVVNRSVARAPWSPAQIVALIIGGILAIIGGVTLARTGINFSDLSSNHVTVAGMDQTAIMGIGELVIGLFLIGAGAVPGGGRVSMTFWGVVLLGFGIVLLISDSSTSMHRWFTDDSGTGWFFVVMAAVLLVTAMAAPVIFGSDRRAVARRSAIIER
jgi:hypothetical protein